MFLSKRACRSVPSVLSIAAIALAAGAAAQPPDDPSARPSSAVREGRKDMIADHH